MFARAVDHLRCPHCAGDLALLDVALGCPQGHRFDLARQGYANLLAAPAAHPGDDAAMVEARERFLAAGHLAPVGAAVTDLVAASPAGPDQGAVVELGAGTGYHLARVLDRLPGTAGVALDASRYAARRAARAHPWIGAVVCDVWRSLPVRSTTAAAVLCIFAPRHAPEVRRILRPGGRFVLVSPTERHLAELVGSLGLLTIDVRKQDRLTAELTPHLTPRTHATLEYRVPLGRDEVRDVVAMGPSSHHVTDAQVAERIHDLDDPLEVTVSVVVSRFDRDR